MNIPVSNKYLSKLPTITNYKLGQSCAKLRASIDLCGLSLIFVWSENEFLSKKDFGSEKNVWSKTIFSPKNLLSRKVFAPQKNWVQKILGQTKFLVKKIFESEIFFCPKKCWVRKKKFCRKNVFGGKSF